jgi:hypothetical protein
MPSLPNTQQSSDHRQSRIAITEECDFPGAETVTGLKCFIGYEFHREAALEGWQPAKVWLEQEYPGWNKLPWAKVAIALRQARIDALEKQEHFETVCHMTPTLSLNTLKRAISINGARRLPHRVKVILTSCWPFVARSRGLYWSR